MHHLQTVQVLWPKPNPKSQLPLWTHQPQQRHHPPRQLQSPRQPSPYRKKWHHRARRRKRKPLKRTTLSGPSLDQILQRHLYRKHHRHRRKAKRFRTPCIHLQTIRVPPWQCQPQLHHPWRPQPQNASYPWQHRARRQHPAQRRDHYPPEGRPRGSSLAHHRQPLQQHSLCQHVAQHLHALPHHRTMLDILNAEMPALAWACWLMKSSRTMTSTA
jgi:hypothetical protein